MGKYLEMLRTRKLSECVRYSPDKTDKLNKSVKSVPYQAHLLRIKQDTGLTDYSFLNETPFTKAMIMEGLKRWQEPFDQNDLDEIMSGELPLENARKYLFLWEGQNQERYQILKS